MPTILSSIIEILSGTGFSFRGAFHPEYGDSVPEGTGTVVLVGNIGRSMWSSFEAGRRDETDALDSWTRRTLDGLIPLLNDLLKDRADNSVTAIHPSDGPPYYPFQRWAMRAECVYPSPIGPLIHPEYGLWHAYRGALMFRETMELPAHCQISSPCEACKDKPCLTTCPVGAFTPGAYDTASCANHLTMPEGDSCLAQGCLARRACPVGQAYAYDEAQARFHMGHFRDNHARMIKE